jgi:predicted TIM-barrel fold metal-dependent hydrolase
MTAPALTDAHLNVWDPGQPRYPWLDGLVLATLLVHSSQAVSIPSQAPAEDLAVPDGRLPE